MQKLTKADLEDLALILEDLIKRLPEMKREERIDVCARIRTVAKHCKSIEDTVKDEIKAKCKGKEGYVNGEVFKAKLSLVPTTRLDQKALKEENPKVYSLFAKDTEDQRITFEPR
jgi:predicted phage-related endonuclease